jgi:hypothetical protein
MYKGDLEGFEEPIVEWMLDQQVAQGNKRDVTVFETDLYRGARTGGFTWIRIPTWNGMSGTDFCDKVITDKDFDLFINDFLNNQKRLFQELC